MKSRTAWLTNGDRNTKLFHSRMMTRRRINKVEGLKFDEGEWCFDDENLKLHAIDFFQKLYMAEELAMGNFPCRGM